MRMRNRLAIIILMVCVSCSGGSGEPTETDRVVLGAQLDSIEAIFASQEPTEVMLARYMDYFAPDAVLLPPGAEPIRGLEASLAFYTTAFEGLRAVSLDYDTPDVLLDGNVALRRYDGVAVVLSGVTLDTLMFTNHYIDVVRRGADGEWRIVWHLWRPTSE
jgi:ketosteroid isomerase-like protein